MMLWSSSTSVNSLSLMQPISRDFVKKHCELC